MLELTYHWEGDYLINTSQRAPSNQRGKEAPKNTWLLLDHMDSMKETDAERDDPNAESH